MSRDSFKCMNRYILSFLDYLKDLNYSPLTIKRYKEILAKFAWFLKDKGCDINVAELSRSLILSFLQCPSENGHSPQTRNVKLSALKTFFQYLLEEGRIESNPCFKIDFAKTSRKPPLFLTASEYMEFLEVVWQHTQPSFLPRNYAMVIILYNTGLRVSEIASLNVEMINFETSEFQGVKVKGGEICNVPFNSAVPVVLRKWLKIRKKQIKDGEPALFVSRQDKRLSVRQIEHFFAFYSKKWKKKKVTPHVLRHSMATELAMKGENIRVISEILHHQSLNTTKIYLHLVEDSKKKALESLVLRPRAKKS